ncbi:MAG: SDR family NAD(P)-dependent oxidoreductase [Acidimicrobiia bacterium]|nr:SDR family NAD(P)-dependent oxidoreductase [Acidimicrobiia bacterium]
MGALDGRVAIITGAGRGLGREHALLFAAEGAKVVVNDLGGANDGTGTDAVIAVHLKGHFAPTRHAAVYWREQAKAGVTKPRNIVHTSSTSGLFSNPGQGNYGAAKSGIATFSQICAKELARYNVKSNAIAPAARTRLTLATPGLEEVLAPKAGEFDKWDPANVSPLVAYLSSEKCEFTGETFFVQGGQVTRVQSWTNAETIDQDDRWSVSALASAMSSLKPKS